MEKKSGAGKHQENYSPKNLNMKRTLKLIAWASVIVAGVYSIPSTTTFAREENNPLQSYCLMAQADAQYVSIGENVKAVCN